MKKTATEISTLMSQFPAICEISFSSGNDIYSVPVRMWIPTLSAITAPHGTESIRLRFWDNQRQQYGNHFFIYKGKRISPSELHKLGLICPSHCDFFITKSQLKRRDDPHSVFIVTSRTMFEQLKYAQIHHFAQPLYLEHDCYGGNFISLRSNFSEEIAARTPKHCGILPDSIGVQLHDIVETISGRFKTNVRRYIFGTMLDAETVKTEKGIVQLLDDATVLPLSEYIHMKML